MTGAPGLPVVGAPTPALTLPDAHGAPVAVGGPAASPVLLVFVPFAFSRVCTAELTELQEHLPELAAAGVAVRAASCDPGPALRAWADKDGYAFPLLSDFWPHGEVSRAFGVFHEGAGAPTRGTFLIDRDGVIRWSLVNEIGQARDFSGYHEALAALR